MTWDQPGFTYSGIAGEVIGQYRAVRMQADGKYDVADTPGQDYDGVAQIAAAADGDVISIMSTGISKMLVGTGGVTRGDKVQVIADGIALAATGDFVIGTALETGAAGVLVPVLLSPRDISA